jgi:molybdate transport system substrate-binding protein
MQSLHNFMPPHCDSKRRFLRLAARVACGAAVVVPGMQSWAMGKVRVAAASDLKFALARVAAQFQSTTGIVVEASFGSSGNFARQIAQGLPVDIFMSADEDWVTKLVEAGHTQGAGVVYGQGRLALLVPTKSSIALDADLHGLKAQWSGVRKFAIANPDHAPYGRAAQQALQTLGLWDMVQPKLVLGENIAQATQFVTTGAAQAGITALPLASAPEVATMSRHISLSTHLHAPLRQRMVLLKNASPQATQFFSFMQSDAARKTLQSFGFTEPA